MYGGASLTAVTYGSAGWTPNDTGTFQYGGATGWTYRTGGSNAASCANVNLPSGALLEGITTFTDDADAANDIVYLFFVLDLMTGTNTTPLNISTTGAPGIERIFRPLAPPITIDNDATTYTICVLLPGIGGTTRFGGATFWYRLQVSPAPATATFPNDVPTTHPLFRFVEALAASGITGGCGAGSFCPDAPLTRGQMAVFLSAALGLHFPN